MSSKSEKSEADKRDRLYAVIMANKLFNKFHPATQDCPLALFPLVNNPMIFYSFEWLKCNKVDETIIYCNESDAEDITSHCKVWSSAKGNDMKLTVIGSGTSSSVGDAMRDLYSKDILKNDFILLDGFIVGNTYLKRAVQIHKQYVLEDPTCIMTCLYKKRTGPPSIKPRNMDNVRFSHILVNESNSRVLVNYRPTKPAKSHKPTKLFASSPEMNLWSVEDPHISICSEKVPSLYSVNKKYDTMESLIEGVLDFEILGCSIRAHMLRKGHMQLVSSIRAYEELSNLIVRRWFCPLVPERSLSTNSVRYMCDDPHNNYYAKSAKFYRDLIGTDNVIGDNAKIDKQCKMNNSVVGKNCTIRGGVIIKNSVLMDDVVIGNGCVVNNCIIGSNVRLFPGVTLEPGVILGPNVLLGPNLKVNRGKRLVSDSNEGKPNVKPYECGRGGKAYEVVFEVEIDFTDFMKLGFPDLKYGDQPLVVDCLPSIKDYSISFEELKQAFDLKLSPDKEKEDVFEKELIKLLKIAYRDNCRRTTITPELKTFIEAHNLSSEIVLRVVVKTVLHVVETFEGKQGLTGDKLLESVQKGLNCFEGLVAKCVQYPKHQIIILNILESLINEEERYLVVIQHIFRWLSEKIGIVDDEVIIYWHKRGGLKTPKFPLISKEIKEFVEWLEGASEEEH